MRLIGYCLLLAAAIATAWQLIWLGPQLPDPVASHFNANGQPNGWSSRSGFRLMHFLVQFGMASLLLGIAYGTKWIPDELINMPNKDYWLHPDRRAESLQKNGGVLVFIAGITSVLVAVVFQLVYVTNVQQNGQLPATSMLGPLVIYFLALGLAIWQALRNFKLPPQP